MRGADRLLASDLRPAPLLSRPAVVVSLVLHLAAFLAFLGIPRLLGRSVLGNSIYVVDLVTLPGGSESPGPTPAAPAAAPAPQPPAPKPAPAPAKPAPKPVVKAEPPARKPPERAIVLPDRGAKKKKEKPEPAKNALPKPTENETSGVASAGHEKERAAATNPSPPPVPAPAAGGGGGAAGTSPGGSPGAGAPGTGTSDVYSFYIALLDRTIRNAWSRPVYTGHDVKTALVRLQLSPTGRVVRLELATASGFEPLDRSALRAVRDAEPFPPFPASLSLDSLTVPIEFQLNPEGTTDEPGP